MAILYTIVETYFNSEQRGEAHSSTVYEVFHLIPPEARQVILEVDSLPVEPSESPVCSIFYSLWFFCFLRLYSFPVAAVTNYPKAGDLKQHKFIVLRFWRSGAWNRDHWGKIGLQSCWGPKGRISFLAISSLGWPPPLLVCDLPTSDGMPLSHTAISCVSPLPPLFLLWIHWPHPDNPG